MNGNCLDIGTIQAFLDGELTPDVSMSVTNHIAGCDNCSFMLGEAEEESAFVFPVLEREMNSLVPTQRLWTRINDSIAIEKENAPFWRKFLAGAAAQLRNPSLAVAASVLIIFGIIAGIYSVETKSSETVRAVAIAPTKDNQPISVQAPVRDVVTTFPIDTASKPKSVTNDSKFAVIQADYHRKPERNIQSTVNAVAANTDGYLPGEESYVKTIANLNQTVAGKKDTAMRPSQRVSYERDLAVVNDSIKRMRDEVRKDPKNESAKQVLYSSYQNKIDLLNSVAQKEELVASLK
ncbi:MAG: zf-HC2 domain-containing protein [Acidobacteriota bacterium]